MVPAIDCNSSKYRRWLVLVVFVLMAFVVALPLGVLFFLYWNRHQLHDPKRSKSFASRYGILFEVSFFVFRLLAETDNKKKYRPTPRRRFGGSWWCLLD